MTLQKIKKPLAKQRFAACRKVDQNTLYNLSFIDTFGPIFAFWVQKASKTLYSKNLNTRNGFLRKFPRNPSGDL